MIKIIGKMIMTPRIHVLCKMSCHYDMSLIIRYTEYGIIYKYTYYS